MGINSINFKFKTFVYHFFLKRRFKNLELGKSVEMGKNLQIHKTGKIIIGDRSRIRMWTCLNPYGGEIIIGENCSINSFCHISGNGGVYIGNNVLLATQCVIISANHIFSRIDIPICEQGETHGPVVVKDDCWLGAGVKVLAGVTIERGVIIGAGSVVTKNIPKYSVCVGVPAEIIKNRMDQYSQ
ncbi:MAG: acyltransferase [Desulfobulbus sp.]|nr:acyltransferase [Desulfobulbus sp.]